MASIFGMMSPGALLLSWFFFFVLLNALLFSNSFKRFLRKYIFQAINIVYMAGFFLYLIGFWYGGSSNFFTASLRASMSALTMFMFHSDILEVAEPLKEGSTVYMILFALTHFLATIITTLAFLDLFGKRLLSRLEIIRMRNRSKGKKIYVFDGYGEAEMSIAKTIPDNPEGKVIAFIKGNSNDKINRISFSDFMLFGKNHKEIETRIKDSVILNYQRQLVESITTPGDYIHKEIIKMLSNYKDPEVFFMSEDSKINSDAAFNLCQDMKEAGLAVKIYAGVNTDDPYSYKLEGESSIIPVSRSEMKVVHMLEETPILGCGNDKNTLVIGFGHTGRECVKQLHARGFKHICVVDKNMDKVNGAFRIMYPEIIKEEGYTFLKLEADSNEYWDFIDKNISQFDNVLIFNKNDETAYTTGIRLIEHEINAGRDLKNFRIYVGQKSMESTTYAKATIEKYKLKSELIYPFGELASIYDYRRLDAIKKGEVTVRNSNIDNAIRLALSKFYGEKDLDGMPAVLHSIGVGLAGKTDDEKIVGFLHDVVEDTDVSLAEVRHMGFSQEVVDALKLCTRDKEIPYDEYVTRILESGNKTAMHVKINDLKNNIARGKITIEVARAAGDMEKVAKMERINSKHEKALARFPAQELD